MKRARIASWYEWENKSWKGKRNSTPAVGMMTVPGQGCFCMYKKDRIRQCLLGNRGLAQRKPTKTA